MIQKNKSYANRGAFLERVIDWQIINIAMQG